MDSDATANCSGGVEVVAVTGDALALDDYQDAASVVSKPWSGASRSALCDVTWM
jgi:hypothetical protein